MELVCSGARRPVYAGRCQSMVLAHRSGDSLCNTSKPAAASNTFLKRGTDRADALQGAISAGEGVACAVLSASGLRFFRWDSGRYRPGIWLRLDSVSDRLPGDDRVRPNRERSFPGQIRK